MTDTADFYCNTLVANKSQYFSDLRDAMDEKSRKAKLDKIRLAINEFDELPKAHDGLHIDRSERFYFIGHNLFHEASTLHSFCNQDDLAQSFLVVSNEALNLIQRAIAEKTWKPPDTRARRK